MHYIKGVLRNNNRINIAEHGESGYGFISVYGKNIAFCHGHQFRNKKPDLIIKELNMLFKTEIHILIVGHLHHEQVKTVGETDIGNIKVIYLPSLMGSDNFSDVLFTGSKAGATLFELKSNKKGITSTEVILN